MSDSDLLPNLRMCFHKHYAKLEISKKYALVATTSDNPLHFNLCKSTQDILSIAHFELSCVPGCTSAVIFSGAYVGLSLRRAGLGKTLHKLRLDACREAGYTLALCTVNKDNAPQNKIMDSFGWICGREFDTSPTSKARLWYKIL